MARRNSVTDDELVDSEDDAFDVDLSLDEDEEEVDDLEDSEDDEEDDDDADDEEPPAKRGGTERGAKSGDDWESRFKGLQSSVQRKEEQNQQLMQQVIMARAEAFKAQLMASDLEPEEQQRQFQGWMAQQALQLQAMKNQSDQAALEEVSRAVLLQQIASINGIDPKSKTFERMSRMKDPDDMQAFAEEIASSRKTAAKTTKKEVRKATNTKRKFDNGASRAGTTPPKKAKNLDDAAALFSKYKIEI